MIERNLQETESPLCPVFGACGGCLYQDIPYPRELALKESWLRGKMKAELSLDEACVSAIVASPQAYHYRHRLDLGLRKTKEGEIRIGFSNPETRQLIDIQECSIARPEVSAFIPKLREEAKRSLPADYRRANLTVKTGDDGRVLWGGIGKKSQRLEEKDYLWVEIEGCRIYYALDHFFQANHAILPSLFEVLKREIDWNAKTVFFDLYGGVGLFSLVLAPWVKKVVLVEESKGSIQMAHYNAARNGYAHFNIVRASVENCLGPLIEEHRGDECVAMVDPPRKGLAPSAREVLKRAVHLKCLIYLSCNPESLISDLKDFLEVGWRAERVIPFDFFPRTKHLETLAILAPPL